MDKYKEASLNAFVAIYDQRQGEYDVKRVLALPSPRIGFGFDLVTTCMREDHGVIAFRIPEVFAHLPLWEFFSTRPIDKSGTRVIGVIYPRHQSGDDVLTVLGKALDRYALKRMFLHE